MKMRIAIREQLALLVLFCCLICLAVISVATWITNNNFVVGISLSNLALTASLYSQQLSASLVLLEASIQSISTRVLIQNSLRRYNQGNNTRENWINANSDLQTALVGGGSSQALLQGRIVGKNSTGLGGPYGLINVTGNAPPIALPYFHPNGSSVFLGDLDGGYPPNLYPNITYGSRTFNNSFAMPDGTYEEMSITADKPLMLGPWQINETFALLSITLPITNTTSAGDVLGWITVIISAQLLFDVKQSTLGIGNTGVVLIAGPQSMSNRFAPGVSYLNGTDSAAQSRQRMRFVLAPSMDPSRSTRHPEAAFGKPNYSFALQDYPAINTVVTNKQNEANNAGSVLDTHDENNDHVSTGFAYTNTTLADWIIVVEQSYDEVVQPIDNLRNVLVACLFGTMGGILICLFPIAHYSVRPIRLLRSATLKTVEPYQYSNDGDSERNSIRRSNSDNEMARDEENLNEIARKEGFVTRASRWPFGRKKNQQRSRTPANGRKFRIPGKVNDGKHFITDELTDLTTTFNAMSEELMMQYARLEERVKERTAELELSKKAAEAANESKTMFIANISHELKTPLNGILGMCAVCMHEEDQTKIKRSLNIIYKSGDLLLNLLTDLLTFSKNQIGQQLTLDEKEFRVADISSQVLSIFDKQAKEASIALAVNFEGPHESLETASGTPGQPGYGPFGTGKVKDMFLWGDQHRILQVVINLVSNSLKFTPPGGCVTVRVKCIGDAEVEQAASSRKGSTNSKQSKASRGSKNLSFREVRNRIRGPSASGSRASMLSISQDGEPSKSIHTALEINSRDSKTLPQLHVRERSSSPPPINARVLLFEFEVEDTGPGIPLAQQQQVFEPFVQGDLGLSKKYGGTGLGLSICSQLATLMKGSIFLRSVEGEGSTFTLRIPLRYVKERADSTTSSNLYEPSRNSFVGSDSRDQPHTPRRAGSDSDLSVHSTHAVAPVPNGFESPVPKPRLVGLSTPFFATSPPLDGEKDQIQAIEHVKAVASQSGTKVRVLVAEDNSVNQEVVLRMLKLEDIYDVTVAKDGQEAFDLVKESMEQKKLFNLIFMDIQMPNMDGLQSTRLIRGIGYSTPIVALTAFAEESNVQECMDSGMDFFLPKPIKRPALKQVLKRYCATIPEDAEDMENQPLATKVNNGGSDTTTETNHSTVLGNSTTAGTTPEIFREDDISPLS